MSDKSFIDVYKTLEGCVEALSDMSEPDIDKIMPLVTDGMNAYREVSARILAVRNSVEEMQKEITKEA